MLTSSSLNNPATLICLYGPLDSYFSARGEGSDGTWIALAASDSTRAFLLDEPPAPASGEALRIREGGAMSLVVIDDV